MTLALKQETTRAAALLECAARFVERGWTKEANARTEHGAACAPDSPDAACWCAQGGLHAASHKVGCHTLTYGCTDPGLPSEVLFRNTRIINRARQALYWCITEDEGYTPSGGASIVGWNDSWVANGAQVARGMRGAAERLRQEAA